LLFLVVDDDALSRDLLTLLLEAEGHDAETAVSGEAAVARMAASAFHAKGRLPLPDVILADIQMPGLAGDALASALRAQLNAAEPGGYTVLLAMSGSQPAASALTGFDGFLLKPFQVRELESMIQTAAPRSQQGAPAGESDRPATKIARGSESSAEDSPDALDEDIYAKMQELMPAAQLGQMYALCIDDARKRIARMAALADRADDAEYRKEAHAVKGGSGMIGASELYALAAAAEQHGLELPRQSPGPEPGTSSVTAQLARLSLACERLERILQERTQGHERAQE